VKIVPGERLTADKDAALTIRRFCAWIVLDNAHSSAIRLNFFMWSPVIFRVAKRDLPVFVNQSGCA
jgi:hypothetical protein